MITTKSILLIALALAALCVMPSMAQVDFYENKYVEIKPDTDIMSSTGHVYGNLKCGMPLEGGQVFYVHNDAAPENVSVRLEFTKDGNFDDFWIPGNYTVTLPQGTGSAGPDNLHPEVAKVSVAAGQISRFTFLGNAFPSASEPEHKPVYTIIEATYGATQCREVVDVPEHTEYRYWISESGHWEGSGWGRHWHVDVPAHWSSWSDNTPAGYTTHGHHADEFDHRTVSATYRTECIGETVDVTQNVQEAVNKGYLSFLFDNSLPHTGIYDLSTSILLSEIQDPAQGIVKNVYIEYTKDGFTNIIQTMEYEPITL